MADLYETGQSNLSAIINLTGYEVRENDDGVVVGDFSFTFPHAHPSAHNFIILSGQDADLFEVVENQLKLKTGQRANYEAPRDFYSNLVANLWINAVGTTLTTELAAPYIEQLTDESLSAVGIVNLALESDYNKTQINFTGLVSTGIEYL